MTRVPVKLTERRIEVNGADLSNYSRAVTAKVAVGDAPRVYVELLARAGLDVTLDAEVFVNVMTLPGHEVISEVLEDGRTRYTVTREVKA